MSRIDRKTIAVCGAGLVITASVAVGTSALAQSPGRMTQIRQAGATAEADKTALAPPELASHAPASPGVSVVEAMPAPNPQHLDLGRTTHLTLLLSCATPGFNLNGRQWASTDPIAPADKYLEGGLTLVQGDQAVFVGRQGQKLYFQPGVTACPS